MSNPFLTIVIPTYNRGKILDGSLAAIACQFNDEYRYKIELIVCDNHSPDNTEQVVSKHIDNGLPIIYIKNETNIGPDLNFAKSMKASKGKYIWMLGDDDYLKPNTISFILTELESGNYGLVHIHKEKKCKTEHIEFSNPNQFISLISQNICFISTHIFLRAAAKLEGIEKYNGSFLLQVPVYLSAALSSPKNLLINTDVLQQSKMLEFNGGFNPYQVFLVNYFAIWRQFMHSWWRFEIEKYHTFRLWFLDYIGKRILGKKNNYTNTNALRTLFRFYWECPYFYVFIPLKVLILLPKRIKGTL